MTINLPEGTSLLTYPTTTVRGINGRGVKRPSSSQQIGGRTVVTAEDVSSQDNVTTK